LYQYFELLFFCSSVSTVLNVALISVLRSLFVRCLPAGEIPNQRISFFVCRFQSFVSRHGSPFSLVMTSLEVVKWLWFLESTSKGPLSDVVFGGPVTLCLSASKCVRCFTCSSCASAIRANTSASPVVRCQSVNCWFECTSDRSQGPTRWEFALHSM